jgi:hypothetical protein
MPETQSMFSSSLDKDVKGTRTLYTNKQILIHNVFTNGGYNNERLFEGLFSITADGSNRMVNGRDIAARQSERSSHSWFAIRNSFTLSTCSSRRHNYP